MTSCKKYECEKEDEATIRFIFGLHTSVAGFFNLIATAIRDKWASTDFGMDAENQKVSLLSKVHVKEVEKKGITTKHFSSHV